MADLNPCSNCVSQSAYTKLLVSDSATVWTTSHRLRFLGEDIRLYSRKSPIPAITGDIQLIETLLHTGGDFVYGTLTTEVNAGDLNELLPWLIGPEGDTGTGTGTAGGLNTFTPASCPTIKHFYVWRDHDKTFRLVSCYVASWSIQGRSIRFREEGQGDLLQLSMFIVGSSRVMEDQGGTPTVAWPDPEPALGTGDEFAPYYFKDGALTLRSTSYGNYVEQFRLSVNNGLDFRYRMSDTFTAACSGGRTVILDTKMDWRDETSNLHEQADNQAASLAFTGSNGISTTFSFHKAVEITQDPAALNKPSNVNWPVRHLMVGGDTASSEWDISCVNITGS